MTIDLMLALAVFATVAFITPRPSNLMLMASGLSYGARRTIPHLPGVDLGFGVMIAIVGLGLMPVFDAFSVVYTVMKVLGTGYLLYLAWRIANSGPLKHDAATGGIALSGAG